MSRDACLAPRCHLLRADVVRRGTQERLDLERGELGPALQHPGDEASDMRGGVGVAGATHEAAAGPGDTDVDAGGTELNWRGGVVAEAQGVGVGLTGDGDDGGVER